MNDFSTSTQSANRASWASLASSSATLICCTLPALLVAIGAGATMVALTSAVPQLVWLSEHKTGVFGFAGLMLLVSGWLQWRAQSAPCPADPALAAMCTRARQQSRWVYAVSVGLFAIGGLFAFVLPALLAAD